MLATLTCRLVSEFDLQRVFYVWFYANLRKVKLQLETCGPNSLKFSKNKKYNNNNNERFCKYENQRRLILERLGMLVQILPVELFKLYSLKLKNEKNN